MTVMLNKFVSVHLSINTRKRQNVNTETDRRLWHFYKRTTITPLWMNWIYHQTLLVEIYSDLWSLIIYSQQQIYFLLWNQTMPLYLQASYSLTIWIKTVEFLCLSVAMVLITERQSAQFAVAVWRVLELGRRYNCERNYSVHAFHALSSNLVHSFSIESPTYLYAKRTLVSVAFLLSGKRTRIDDLACRLSSYRTSSHCGLRHISQLSLFRKKFL